MPIDPFLTRAMDDIWLHASQIFEKKPEKHELCIIKPEILKLITDIEVK